MILRYTPEGAEPTEFPFKPRKLMSAEAEAIERVTGWDFGGEFGQKLMTGSMLARRALLWVMLKRSTPTLRFEQVSICMDDVALDYDREELDAIAAQLPAMSATEAAAAQAMLDAHGWSPLEAADPTQPGDRDTVPAG